MSRDGLKSSYSDVENDFDLEAECECSTPSMEQSGDDRDEPMIACEKILEKCRKLSCFVEPTPNSKKHDSNRIAAAKRRMRALERFMDPSIPKSPRAYA